MSVEWRAIKCGSTRTHGRSFFAPRAESQYHIQNLSAGLICSLEQHTVVGVEDDRDAIGRSDSTNVVGSSDGTDNRGLLLLSTVLNSLACEVSGASLRCLQARGVLAFFQPPSTWELRGVEYRT